MLIWNLFNQLAPPAHSRKSLALARPTATAQSPLAQPGTPKLCPVPDPDLPPSAWVAAHLGFTPDPAQARFLDGSQKRTGRVGPAPMGEGLAPPAGPKRVRCARFQKEPA